MEYQLVIIATNRLNFISVVPAIAKRLPDCISQIFTFNNCEQLLQYLADEEQFYIDTTSFTPMIKRDDVRSIAPTYHYLQRYLVTRTTEHLREAILSLQHGYFLLSNLYFSELGLEDWPLVIAAIKKDRMHEWDRCLPNIVSNWRKLLPTYPLTIANFNNLTQIQVILWDHNYYRQLLFLAHKKGTLQVLPHDLIKVIASFI